MTTSLTSPRIALLSPQAHYTIPELRERWRVAAHIAHREIHHALLAGELFLTACEPLTYSRTPPATSPELPAEWQEYIGTLAARTGDDRVLLYHDLLALWTGHSISGKRLIPHLISLGLLTRLNRGRYSVGPPPEKLPPLPTEGLSTERAAALRQERLAAASWPARLWQLTAAWQLSSGAANAYLTNLRRQGAVQVHQGVYYLPHQQRPNPADYPTSAQLKTGRPTKALSRTADKPAPTPRTTLDDARIMQATWPTTAEKAGYAWNLSPESAAQVLSRMVGRGLLQRTGRGIYDLASRADAMKTPPDMTQCELSTSPPAQ